MLLPGCFGRLDRRALRESDGNRLCSATYLSSPAKMLAGQARPDSEQTERRELHPHLVRRKLSVANCLRNLLPRLVGSVSGARYIPQDPRHLAPPIACREGRDLGTGAGQKMLFGNRSHKASVGAKASSEIDGQLCPGIVTSRM
jgi:hypothetical protein